MNFCFEDFLVPRFIYKFLSLIPFSLHSFICFLLSFHRNHRFHPNPHPRPPTPTLNLSYSLTHTTNTRSLSHTLTHFPYSLLPKSETGVSLSLREKIQDSFPPQKLCVCVYVCIYVCVCVRLCVCVCECGRVYF